MIEEQNALIDSGAQLVRRIAYHLMARLPPSVQVDDLEQAGMIGLLEAARNYDAKQGASFDTYAGIRIRGAMLDEVRKNNWAPRTLNRKMRQITEAIQAIEAEEGRDARDSEVAKRLEMDLDEYHRTLRDATGRTIFGFDDLAAGSEGVAEGMLGTLAGPLETVVADEVKDMVSENILSLPERERWVIQLYYYEELNLREIGHVLSVSESRVCQIHSQAVARLKARLDDSAERAENHVKTEVPRRYQKRAAAYSR